MDVDREPDGPRPGAGATRALRCLLDGERGERSAARCVLDRLEPEHRRHAAQVQQLDLAAEATNLVGDHPERAARVEIRGDLRLSDQLGAKPAQPATVASAR